MSLTALGIALFYVFFFLLSSSFCVTLIPLILSVPANDSIDLKRSKLSTEEREKTTGIFLEHQTAGGRKGVEHAESIERARERQDGS